MKHFGAICLLFIATLWAGWTLKMIWGWHVVPLGAPAIGLLQALGVRLVVTFFKGPGKKDDDSGYSVAYVTESGIRCLVYDTSALGLGYIYWVFQ